MKKKEMTAIKKQRERSGGKGREDEKLKRREGKKGNKQRSKRIVLKERIKLRKGRNRSKEKRKIGH